MLLLLLRLLPTTPTTTTAAPSTITTYSRQDNAVSAASITDERARTALSDSIEQACKFVTQLHSALAALDLHLRRLCRPTFDMSPGS